jgi:hypothetical protein
MHATQEIALMKKQAWVPLWERTKEILSEGTRKDNNKHTPTSPQKKKVFLNVCMLHWCYP